MRHRLAPESAGCWGRALTAATEPPPPPAPLPTSEAVCFPRAPPPRAGQHRFLDLAFSPPPPRTPRISASRGGPRAPRGRSPPPGALGPRPATSRAPPTRPALALNAPTWERRPGPAPGARPRPRREPGLPRSPAHRSGALLADSGSAARTSGCPGCPDTVSQGIRGFFHRCSLSRRGWGGGHSLATEF